MFEYMTAQEAAQNGMCRLDGYSDFARKIGLTEL